VLVRVRLWLIAGNLSNRSDLNPIEDAVALNLTYYSASLSLAASGCNLFDYLGFCDLPFSPSKDASHHSAEPGSGISCSSPLFRARTPVHVRFFAVAVLEMTAKGKLNAVAIRNFMFSSAFSGL